MIAAVGSQHCNTPFALFKNSGTQRDGCGKQQNSLRKRIPMEIYLLMRARFCSGSLRNRWFWLLRFITSIHDSQNHTILDQEMSYQLSVVVDRKLARNLEWKWLLGMHLPTIVLYCSTQILDANLETQVWFKQTDIKSTTILSNATTNKHRSPTTSLLLDD